jgi:hypothetical protein
LVEHETLLATYIVSLLIVVTSFLFDFMRIATYDLGLALTLRACDLVDINPYDQFPLLISMSLYLLIQ